MKHWYTSKTLWFNVVAFVIAVLENYGYTGLLPDEWALFIPAAIALVNFILRWVTSQKLTR